MKDETPAEPEETHFDRKKMYDKLIAKGVPDKEAVEMVWPSTTVARIARNAADKVAADEKIVSDQAAADAKEAKKAAKKAAE